MGCRCGISQDRTQQPLRKTLTSFDVGSLVIASVVVESL